MYNKNIFKYFLVFSATYCMLACNAVDATKQSTARITISKQIDKWHAAAANAQLEEYFSVMTKDAVFIGTDATEYWQGDSFKVFCKPYFDKGKAWTFTPISRNIYFANSNMAWFDELLSTQMKICRGSGIMVLENNTWKIKHYVLSMTIPNAHTKEVVAIKTTIEDSIIGTFNK